MRRPVLLTLAAVGGVIVLLGGTGIFAALSDTTRSGTNSIDTGALAASSDLRVATAVFPGPGFPVSCGSFSEDLTSALFTISGPPGTDTGQSYEYCLLNVGSQTVNLSAAAEDLDESEVGCTGDESIFDTTCGSGLGELGDIVQVAHIRVDCGSGLAEPANVMSLRATSTQAAGLGSLGPGETGCFSVSIYQSAATEVQRQQAQSDRLTWRFAWTGQA